MLIDKIPKLTEDELASVIYEDDPDQYDISLAQLCSKYKRCLVINPHISDPKLVYFIDHIPDNQGQCLIFYYKDEWIAKIFYRGWQSEQGYLEIKLPVPQLVWRKNPEIDNSMTFEQSPFGSWEPEPWDLNYTMTWYMDPQFDHTGNKVWVMTAEVIGSQSKGIKDMGYLTPEIDIEINPEIPNLNIDLDGAFPDYWELSNECVYALDQSHCRTDEKVWMVKITPRYRKAKDWKWIGSITPQPEIVYNPEVGILDYDLDLTATDFGDFEFTNVYLLDRKHLNEDDDNVWAFKVVWTDQPSGEKVIANVSPVIHVKQNSDVNFTLVHEPDHNLKLENFSRVNTWYLDKKLTGNQKIWAVKSYIKQSGKILDKGTIDIVNDTVFDVIFISYDEVNAQENFKRLKQFAPNAQRVKKVKGILEAHKKAAALAKTDMVWIVDGDAYIDDNWRFDYIPSIFDKSFVHVWHSRNPLTDLSYGYGGVKLFPTQKLLSITEWDLDLTLAIGRDGLKVMQTVSNETRFNTSELAAWRAAFRECVKLQYYNQKNSKAMLLKWQELDTSKPFGEWAKLGVLDALEYVKNHDNNKDYHHINDRVWLEKYFFNKPKKKT